jgi:hypothetical protein
MAWKSGTALLFDLFIHLLALGLLLDSSETHFNVLLYSTLVRVASPTRLTILNMENITLCHGREVLSVR